MYSADSLRQAPRTDADPEAAARATQEPPPAHSDRAEDRRAGRRGAPAGRRPVYGGRPARSPTRRPVHRGGSTVSPVRPAAHPPASPRRRGSRPLPAPPRSRPGRRVPRRPGSRPAETGARRRGGAGPLSGASCTARAARCPPASSRPISAASSPAGARASGARRQGGAEPGELGTGRSRGGGAGGGPSRARRRSSVSTHSSSAASTAAGSPSRSSLPPALGPARRRLAGASRPGHLVVAPCRRSRRRATAAARPSGLGQRGRRPPPAVMEPGTGRGRAAAGPDLPGATRSSAGRHHRGAGVHHGLRCPSRGMAEASPVAAEFGRRLSTSAAVSVRRSRRGRPRCSGRSAAACPPCAVPARSASAAARSASSRALRSACSALDRKPPAGVQSGLLLAQPRQLGLAAVTPRLRRRTRALGIGQLSGDRSYAACACAAGGSATGGHPRVSAGSAEERRAAPPASTIAASPPGPPPGSERLGDVGDDRLVERRQAPVSASDSARSLGRFDSCGCRSRTSRSTSPAYRCSPSPKNASSTARRYRAPAGTPSRAGRGPLAGPRQRGPGRVHEGQPGADPLLVTKNQCLAIPRPATALSPQPTVRSAVPSSPTRPNSSQV